MENKIVLSIVIPTKNRANLLKMALQSIERQRADQNVYEVIVIDNGSTDETKGVAKEFQYRIKNYRYIYDARPGLHVGRNRGLLESKGELIGYLDDDVILFPNWINTVLAAFEDKDVVNVVGSVVPYDMSLITKEFISKHGTRIGAFQFVYSICCFWEMGLSEEDTRVHRAKKGMLIGANCVFRKSILYACRGFHPDGMPNHLLMYRGDGETYVEKYIYEHRLKTMYCAQASVYHMIDTGRISDSYISYMYFRNGISDMYTILRESGLQGGIKYLLNTSKLVDAIRSGTFSRIRGRLYLLAYYVFYKRVRRWVHKKDYF